MRSAMTLRTTDLLKIAQGFISSYIVMYLQDVDC